MRADEVKIPIVWVSVFTREYFCFSCRVPLIQTDIMGSFVQEKAYVSCCVKTDNDNLWSVIPRHETTDEGRARTYS